MYQNLHLKRTGYNNYTVHLFDDKTGYNCFEWQKPAFTPNPYGKYTTLDGRSAKKVTYWDKTQETFESDVPPETALLIELYGESEEPPEYQNIFTFDIEVSMEPELPDPDTATNEITSIAYHDNTSDTYGVFILDEFDELPDNIDTEYEIYKCDNEEQLLMKFLDKWEECNPTIVTGWSIDYFDIPYLYIRLVKLFGETVANRLSPVGDVYWNKRKERYFIGGVSCLDYIQIYKNFTYTQLSNYRLDTVGDKELGYGKIEYEGNLDDLKQNNIEKFIDYNIVDVKIVVELEEKLKFIDKAVGICHIGHVQYEDIYHSSKFLEGAIINYLRKTGNRVANNRNFDKSQNGSFDGAYVKEPVTGRYDYIYDLDLTSMYPSIIMSLNISPETKVGKVSGWDFKEFNKSSSNSYTVEFFENNTHEVYNKSQFKKFLKDNEYTISTNGILYRTDIEGVIPAILRKWFDTRTEYKNKMKKFGNEGNDEMYEFYDKEQHIQKILLNSVYGCLGLRGWRWHDVDNALAVTSVGQQVIKFSAQMANSFYNKKLGSVIELETDEGSVKAFENIEYKIKRNKQIDKVLGDRLQPGDEIISGYTQ